MRRQRIFLKPHFPHELLRTNLETTISSFAISINFAFFASRSPGSGCINCCFKHVYFTSFAWDNKFYHSWENLLIDASIDYSILFPIIHIDSLLLKRLLFTVSFEKVTTSITQTLSSASSMSARYKETKFYAF